MDFNIKRRIPGNPEKERVQALQKYFISGPLRSEANRRTEL